MIDRAFRADKPHVRFWLGMFVALLLGVIAGRGSAHAGFDPGIDITDPQFVRANPDHERDCEGVCDAQALDVFEDEDTSPDLGVLASAFELTSLPPELGLLGAPPRVHAWRTSVEIGLGRGPPQLG